MAASAEEGASYLDSLTGNDHYRLYEQPSSALAIFRKWLPDLAKTFVMAMLFMADPLLESDLKVWVGPDGNGKKELAVSSLEQRHIFRETQVNRARAYVLTPEFAKSLRQALAGGGDTKSWGIPCLTPDDDPVTIPELDEFARRQWEGILSYMVGNAAVPNEAETTQPKASVKELLKTGDLVIIRAGGRPEITKDGFTFVLRDVNNQVWQLLMLYVEIAPEFSMTKVEVLSFLFLLSSLQLGISYDKTPLTPNQHRILSDLSDFGIIYQHPPSSTATRFYPTRLATSLTSDSGAVLASVSNRLNSSLRASNTTAGGKGFIIVETNYRLYAYTSSPLQISLLNLFVSLKARFPNLVTGKITKGSIQRAVEAGITADQIVEYLQSHAHPQMKKNAVAKGFSAEKPLPPTVADQIRLWQLAGDRISATPGFLFRDFGEGDMGRGYYDKYWKYASEIGVLVWKSDKKQMFFASRVEQLQSLMKKDKADRMAAGGGG